MAHRCERPKSPPWLKCFVAWGPELRAPGAGNRAGVRLAPPPPATDPLAHRLSLVLGAALASRQTPLPPPRVVGEFLVIKRGVSQALTAIDRSRILGVISVISAF